MPDETKLKLKHYLGWSLDDIRIVSYKGQLTLMYRWAHLSNWHTIALNKEES